MLYAAFTRRTLLGSPVSLFTFEHFHFVRVYVWKGHAQIVGAGGELGMALGDFIL